MRQVLLCVNSLTESMSNLSDFDEFLSAVGGFGKYQIVLFIIIGVGTIPCAWQNFLMIFIGGEQDHWCSGKYDTNASRVNLVTQDISFDTFQRQCKYYDLNFTELGFGIKNSSVPMYAYENDSSVLGKCNNWEYNASVFTSTIRSQWDLVCDREYLVALASSIYMAGVLSGAVTFGTISDIIGRKKAVLAALVLAILSSLSAAVTSRYGYYTPFVILRFLAGNAVAGIITVLFVLQMEIVGRKYRMQVSLLHHGWFAIGFVALCGVAYVCRDHFHLQLVAVVPFVLLVNYVWLLPESPRWLYAENRGAEAEAIMRSIAKHNKKSFSTESYQFHKEGDGKKGEEKATLMDIFRHRRMRARLLILSFCWFVASFVYYGLTYNAGSLSGSVYVNTVISAAVELPALITSCFVLNRFGRRWIAFVTFCLSGVSLLCCIPGLRDSGLSGLVIVMSSIGKFGSTASFATLYLFTAELFPTVVRNVAVGTGSTCARVGSLLAPQLIHVDKYVWFGLSSVLMGSLCAIAGILCLLLPETNRKRLPETLADGERLGTVEYKREFLGESVNLDGKSTEANVSLMEQDAVTKTKLTK